MSKEPETWIECMVCGETWAAEFGLIGVDWCTECGGPLTWMSAEIKQKQMLSETTATGGENAND